MDAVRKEGKGKNTGRQGRQETKKYWLVGRGKEEEKESGREKGRQ